MKNIVLIGMPGCGKSTIGVLLAKTLVKEFVDTDLLIQATYEKSLCDLIAQYGLEGFKRLENDLISQHSFQNCVVATGGSAVYGEEAMKKLKENGILVYLKLSPADILGRIQNITTRGIVMPQGCTITELYDQRAPLYEQFADLTIDCSSLHIEDCVATILKAIQTGVTDDVM